MVEQTMTKTFLIYLSYYLNINVYLSNTRIHLNSKKFLYNLKALILIFNYKNKLNYMLRYHKFQ